MARIRPPAVAGTFYPADAATLRAQVEGLLRAARGAATPVFKALLVPHAGYVYSGPIAASAYAGLRTRAATVRLIILLGPAHRLPVRGLALPGVDRLATPLGEVAIDAAALAAVRDLPQIVESPAAHAFEHALEVQLPFLQCVLDEFTVLPLLVGTATTAQVGEVLERLWGGPETLILISSDLSHYLSYVDAQRVDQASIERVLRLDPGLDQQQACGATPLNGLLDVARRRGLCAHLLDLRNSADTAGDRQRVVGYAAVGFATPDPHRTDADDVALGRAALGHARAAIANALGVEAARPQEHPRLAQPAATFVTLRRHGELRGCIGSLAPRRTMREDVRHNACAAAFDDPRFAALARAELADLRIEVSLLSALQALMVDDEAQALRVIRPHLDGLTLEYAGRRSTLLPQVWEQIAEPAEFLRVLKQKAGLPADFWSPGIELSRYSVSKWTDH